MMMVGGVLGLLLLGGTVLVAVLAGVGLVSRPDTGVRPSGSTGQETARQVVDERFAHG